MKTQLITAAVALFFVGCGNMQDKEAQERKQISASDSLEDSDVSSAIISDQFDEVVSALAQTSDTGASQVSLQLAAGERSFDHSRTCVETDGGLKVDVSRSFNRAVDRNLFQLEISKNVTIERNWSHESMELECTADGKFAAVHKVDKPGLQLSSTYEKSKSVELTSSRRSKSRSIAMSGEREIKWMSTDMDETTYTNTLNIELSSSRSVAVSGSRGERSYESNSQASGIVAEVTRDLETKKWIKKIIKSASVTSTLKNGLVINAEFTDVEFQNSGDTSCKPVSGQITGTFMIPSNGESEAPDADSTDAPEAEETSLASDASDEAVEFTVEFDGETSVVQLGDAEEQLELEACDLVDIALSK